MTTALLWTLLLVIGFSAATQLYWLGSGKIDQRTPTTVAIDLAANVFFVWWISKVLFV